MEKKPRDYLALALDNMADLPVIERLINDTSEYFGVYKVGLEQFTRMGQALFKAIRAAQCRIFLDLKFHDIPNTVAKSVSAAADLDVDLLTIHTSGGLAMMRAAAEAAQKATNPLQIIGVTVLTSIDEDALRNELGVPSTPAEQAKHLAEMAVEAGLGGIVCSAADLPTLKPVVPDSFEVITPGIRLSGGATHDQKRVATPKDAINNGSTLLVIGRAVTGAENPKDAAKEVYDAIC